MFASFRVAAWGAERPLVAAMLVCLTVAPAAAQQTREEALAAQQREKAQQLHPYEPSAIERNIEKAERLLMNPPPVYPFIGSVMPGGLLAVGPGFRHRLPAGALFDVHGAWSLRNYKLGEASVTLPLAGRRVTITGEARWLDAPRVSFFGVGPASRVSDRTHFAFRSTTAGASVRVRPVAIAAIGGHLHYLKVTSDGGELGPRFAATPGLSADPAYLVSGAFAEIDWRDAPGYSRRGGLYRVEWTRYSERETGPYSFDRIDGEMDQFVPLLRANWVLGMRALASVTQARTGTATPFFLMPELGGNRVLRGYAPWRFRGDHRMLLTGEYRWTAGHFVDMALFLDAGKVVTRRADLDLDNLKTSYGIGVRFHTPVSTPLRLELAKTRDGLALVFAFGPSF